MTDNPFAGFDIRVPTQYHEGVKKFCQKSNSGVSVEFAPFDRQVDFWFAALAYAASQGLDPEPAAETTKIIEGSILSSDPHRITLIQLIYLSITDSMEGLANPRGVINFVSELANAGVPRLLQILDSKDDKPLYSLLDVYEDGIE